MTASDTRSTKELFRSWRQGDAASGQDMAQRFADWYYAIAVSRLGEAEGRAPCDNACARFGQGVVQITESRTLVSWAHKIIQDELASRGERVLDGNDPNEYTGNRPPKQLLAMAREALPDEVELLEDCYSGRLDDEALDAKARPLGGMPLGVLKARYRVKQWLKQHAQVPFEVAPDDPILDRAPLPLYESGRMASAEEQTHFEQWMLSDINLCRDIAEFAHFAIALRGGIGEAASTSKPSTSASPSTSSESSSGSGGKLAAAGGVAVVGVVIGVVIVLVLLAAVIGIFLL